MKFELPLPPTTNNAYGTSANNKRSFMYKTGEAKRWQRDAHLIIYSTLGQVKTLTENNVKVFVEMWVTHNRDIDSSFKLLLDTLEYAKIINNDSQIVELGSRKYYGKDENGVELNPNKYRKLVVYVDTTSSKDKGDTYAESHGSQL